MGHQQTTSTCSGGGEVVGEGEQDFLASSCALGHKGARVTHLSRCLREGEWQFTKLAPSIHKVSAALLCRSAAAPGN